MKNDLPEKIIYYNIADIPDHCISGEELELEIKWETLIPEGEFVPESSIRNSEMDELLEQKIRSLLDEKNGCCIRIKKEDITHSIHYGHRSHVVIAVYKFMIYRMTQKIGEKNER